jgi:hypothetical protein
VAQTSAPTSVTSAAIPARLIRLLPTPLRTCAGVRTGAWLVYAGVRRRCPTASAGFCQPASAGLIV